MSKSKSSFHKLKGKKKNGSPCKRTAHRDYKYLVKASVCWILKWISCWSICLRTFSTSNRVFCTSLMHSTWVFFVCTWEEKRQKSDGLVEKVCETAPHGLAFLLPLNGWEFSRDPCLVCFRLLQFLLGPLQLVAQLVFLFQRVHSFFQMRLQPLVWFCKAKLSKTCISNG